MPRNDGGQSPVSRTRVRAARAIAVPVEGKKGPRTEKRGGRARAHGRSSRVGGVPFGAAESLASPSDLAYRRCMDRDTAIRLLKAHEAELRGLGVRHLYLFGSVARNEARPDSDVDLFFDREWGALSLFDIMEIQEVTSRILGCEADTMTRDSLHPVLKDRIENAALMVF